MKKIYLASASPRRKELLEQLGLAFEVVHGSMQEIIPEWMSASDVVRDLACQKAKNIASVLTRDGLIIAADTIVKLDRIIGKPKTQEEAFSMLKFLQGKEHEVFTGICLMDMLSGETLIDHEKTIVKMATLSDDEIRGYISTGEPMDKAGAYGIQGLGGAFIEEIHGCYYNVVGLPLSLLRNMLMQFGVNLLYRNQITFR